MTGPPTGAGRPLPCCSTAARRLLVAHPARGPSAGGTRRLGHHAELAVDVVLAATGRARTPEPLRAARERRPAGPGRWLRRRRRRAIAAAAPRGGDRPGPAVGRADLRRPGRRRPDGNVRPP